MLENLTPLLFHKRDPCVFLIHLSACTCEKNICIENAQGHPDFSACMSLYIEGRKVQ